MKENAKFDPVWVKVAAADSPAAAKAMADFVCSGEHDEGTIQRVTGMVIGGKIGDAMRETMPGTWRGHIEYTYQPAWHATNSVCHPIWEPDGSGSGFETHNLAHRRVGTTAERRSYYPQLGQMFFDTDLGRLLVCTDSTKRLWVDALGQQAD